MVKIRVILFIVIGGVLSACGNIASKPITAKMLNAGNPELVTATAVFPNRIHSSQTITLAAPLINKGFRDALLVSFVFSDHAGDGAFTLDVADSVCAANTVLAPGGQCDISVTFTPLLIHAYSETLTVTYSGAGGTYTAVYPLEGNGT